MGDTNGNKEKERVNGLCRNGRDSSSPLTLVFFLFIYFIFIFYFKGS